MEWEAFTAGDTLADLQARLRRGEPVEEEIGGVGVRIEQPQPVLYAQCVDNDPTDRSLLAGQSSLITASEHDDNGRCGAVFSDIAAAVLSALQERFGCSLLVELWLAAADGYDEGEDIRLFAPGRSAPDRMMDVFERALARGSLSGRPWRVALSVVDRIAGPGLPSLRDRVPPQTGMLGVSVRPRWRGLQGDIAYPQALRDMRRDLGRALKEAAYDFGRRHARTGIQHYHALGTRTFPDRALHADHELGEIADSYSLLLDVTPVNVPAARAAFEASEGQCAPEFHYRPLTFDPAQLKRRLYEIDFDAVEDPALHDILTYKRQEIDREITLLDSRCGRRFLADSLGLFGGVDWELRDVAFRLLERLPPGRGDSGRVLSPEALCERAELELQWLRRRDPVLRARVELRLDTGGLLVERGNLLVGPDASATEARVEALLQHEVGTHILTHHNGAHQPLRQLQSGMAGYEETQEGIAVLAEYLVGGLSGSRLRLLAGRVLAVDALIDGAEFIEVVRLLQMEHGFRRSVAFTVTMRVFRGGGFTKDAIYLRGLVRVLQQLSCGTKLSDMLVGKIALEDWPIVEELLWRKIVRPARLLPRYLDDASALRRLEHASSGISVLQIADEL